ncbi:prepilin-type N-terminal cleavage/methylation domain-containing protein [Entomomonas sp. E2T0]|uniref:type IV pilin protein n=1 Tax=Entomomonas sp. E2T0 TaxID=2930213 RepID=UPI00222833B3|nr:type IV pilin protein [Entomomonas sp. E2T0]UYZ85241.1 prepilin-type N-terminal cleavage/methylation domain-containing protein [Entomomonas sp. E2T0]
MKQTKGFSLIELLIVMAILGIISAIAYPMYTNYTIRAACDNGKAGLMQADALMNQYYIKYGSYDNSDSNAFPITTIPIDGSSSGNADFDIDVVKDTTTYTITATVSANGRLGKYSGGRMTVDQSGTKTANINGIDVWTQGCSSL